MSTISNSSAGQKQARKRFHLARKFAAFFCAVVLLGSGSALYQRLTSSWYWADNIRGFVGYGAHQDQFSADATRVAIAYRNQCKILDLTNGSVVSELEQFAGKALADFSSSGMLLSHFPDAKSNDRSAVLWNTSTGQVSGRIDVPGEDSVPIFSPDGKRIVVVFRYGLVIWDSSNLERDGQIEIAWPMEKWLPGLLAWNPANQELTVVGGDGELLKIDFSLSKATPLLSAQKDPVKSAQWSPDGKRLLTIAREDGSVSVWDVQAGVLLSRLDIKDVLHASFSPDGMEVATATRRNDVARKGSSAPSFWDRSTKIWNATTGNLLRDLPTTGIVTFSADWSFLAETGPEGLRIARSDGTDTCYFPTWFDGHGSSCMFALDNSYLASVNGSGRVAIWRHRDPARFWIDCLTGRELWATIFALTGLAWSLGFVNRLKHFFLGIPATSPSKATAKLRLALPTRPTVEPFS